MARKSRHGEGTVTAQPDPALQRAEGTVEPEETLKERILDAAEPLKERLEKPVARVSRWAKWVQSLRPYRVYINFSHSDGNLRAAGMGFQSLFAVFAAVWLGFSAAGVWLSGNQDIFDSIVDIINRAIPGLISTDTTTGVINAEQLESATAFGWSGIVAAVSLLWTAIGWLYYTRQAVRAVFGLSRDTTNYVLQKIRDLFLALGFGLVLVFSALISIISTQALAFFLQLVGLSSDTFWTDAITRFSGLLISVILNIFTLGAMFRVMARVAIPWRNLFFGVLLGACVLAGLSALGGLLLTGATKNPLLATFAVFVGLLIWFNLVSRVILLSASWIAVGMFDSGLSPRMISPEQAAAERAAAEYEARVLVAKAELQTARDELAHARFLARLGAQRRVEKAEHRLNDLLDESSVGARR
ncbi:YihY/virulence factor BrkB family protein [Leifsonia shinshuensis]|uniref:YihY/virulence factor BrkB family protein n=1 Tax=Leifsonia shinshuensis TaxID=150026 RepID=A0A7G6Y9H3_9MICO|nr:YihY/virulence factor BrkB family protein [Leifsonia shinshuensis]QNE35138.1 YihY/virulence factor BrkB family protein [Leifsonia shinshuensis]